MAIYAFSFTDEDVIKTAVCAAHTPEELNEWFEKNKDDGYLTEPVDHLFVEQFTKFKLPLFVVNHDSENDQTNYCNDHGVTLIGYYESVDMQNDMAEVAELKESVYHDKDDKTSIGDLTGTTEHDPWNVTGGVDVMSGKPKDITSDTSLGNGKTRKEKEETRIGVMGQRQDADGNVNITGSVLTKAEQEEMAERAAENKRKVEEKEESIRQAAKAAGLDVDDPDCVTVVNSNTGVVSQQNKKTNVVVTVAVDGSKTYVDSETGNSLTEKAVLKRNLEQTLKELNEDESDNEDESEEDTSVTTSQPQRIDPKNRRKPSDYEFTIDDDVIIVAHKEWRTNGIAFDPGLDYDFEYWLKEAGFMQIEDNAYDYGEYSIADGRDVLLAANLVEVDGIPDKIDNYPWTLNEPTRKLYKPKDFYFAALPPGFHSDDTTPLVGQEAYIVVMPKDEFKNGKNPLSKGDWIPQRDLDAGGLEEIEPSIYKVEKNIGEFVGMMIDNGAQENGLLLTRMGYDVNNTPYDWPYQYHATDGRRKSKHDFYKESIRILQMARDAGLTLSDEDGEAPKLAGVDLTAIEAEQQDITKAYKDLMGMGSKDAEDDKGNGKP